MRCKQRGNYNRDTSYRNDQIKNELKNLVGDMKKITTEVQKHIQAGKKNNFKKV